MKVVCVSQGGHVSKPRVQQICAWWTRGRNSRVTPSCKRSRETAEQRWTTRVCFYLSERSTGLVICSWTSRAAAENRLQPAVRSTPDEPNEWNLTKEWQQVHREIQLSPFLTFWIWVQKTESEVVFNHICVCSMSLSGEKVLNTQQGNDGMVAGNHEGNINIFKLK